MEIIRLEEAKEYCDKHNVERNEWVAGAMEQVLDGTHAIEYVMTVSGREVKSKVDRDYINSHMQSHEDFDYAFNELMNGVNIMPLVKLQLKQAMLTIGELANDFEIGIA